MLRGARDPNVAKILPKRMTGLIGYRGFGRAPGVTRLESTGRLVLTVSCKPDDRCVPKALKSPVFSQ